jgi:hypothetical protein
MLLGLLGCDAITGAAAKAEEVAPKRSGQPGVVPAVSGPCGESGLMDCPTQQWMKSNLQGPLRNQDFARLAQALEQLGKAAPAGYEGWADSAQRAARAASVGDTKAVRAECSHCHDTHRGRFKAERRTTPLGF